MKREYHYIADDLGIPRDYWCQGEYEPEVGMTWIDFADQDLHVSIEHRLWLERRMDSFGE